jgi:hypothetical protein
MMVRQVAWAAAFAAIFSSNALALENCNKFANDNELAKRLECLQKNNEELSSAIESLNSLVGNFLKNGEPVVIETQNGGDYCLSNDAGGAGFLRPCNYGGAPARFSIHR